ncbi:MAG: hypothetical protein K6F63_04030 [Lachnospiraceae bacterium]|nr:hypothetical protein [Lachnospiraceae bacterium]
MPNDESYLDSLLNGLTSNGSKPDNNDRFSAYRKKNDKKADDKEIRVTPESEKTPANEVMDDAAAGGKAELHDIPDFLDAYLSPKDESKDEEADESDDTHEETFNFLDSDEDDSPALVFDEEKYVTDDEPDVDFETGEIDNYNIFDDYDDAVIDKMINDELSEEGSSGELFAMPEEEKTEPEIVQPEPEEETRQVPEELFGEGNDEEGDALDDLFGNLYSEEDQTQEENKAEHSNDSFDKESSDNDEINGFNLFDDKNKDDDMDLDNFDFFNGVTDNPISENQMENHLADEVFNIEADDENNDARSEEKPELADSEDIFSTNDSNEPGVFYEDGTPANDSLTEETPEFIFGEDTLSGDQGGQSSDDGAEEAFDFLNSGSTESTEENADNFIPEYEDPMSGFTINDIGDENKGSDNGNMFGEIGVESFNEDDLAALDDLLNEIDVDKEEEKPAKGKKSAVKKEKLPWYIQLFGNVKIPENKIKPEIPPEELAKQKAEAAEAKKALREAKKAERDEKKKAAAEAKALKARQSAEEKEAIRKQKLEQASEMILEDVGNTTKLNKWGILVIFALFIGIVAVTVSGGSTLAYNIGVRQASKLFDNALVYKDVTYYTKAYDKIYGLDIEDEDYELYDKILTINYVNTQLNAYNNHALLDDYREGLNDLFKGLLRFRKWFAHATALGAQDDIYLVRSEIYNKLWEIYGIDESEAMFVLEHYDLLRETYGEYDANLYYTRYIYETVDRLGLGSGDQ